MSESINPKIAFPYLQNRIVIIALIICICSIFPINMVHNDLSLFVFLRDLT